MRIAIKVVVLLAVVGVLAAGLLPPLFDEGRLRDNANTAAQAGAAVVLDSHAGLGSGSIDQAVAASIATHRGLKLISVKVNAGVVTVKVEKDVHTFMSGLPGLEHWFHLTVTESASAYGPTQ